MNAQYSRHLKRIAAAAIVLTLVSGGVVSVPFAEAPGAVLTASADTMTGTVYGTNVEWTYDSSTNTVTFSGSGTASVYTNILELYRKYIKTIICEEGVTGIQKCNGCTNLTSVQLPSTLTSIGSFAFAGCTSLESVSIPESVKQIGNSAFQNCTSLTSAELPNELETIGDSVFDRTKLTSVKIPDTVTSIGSEAFRSSSLESVTIPSSVQSIGSYAFADTSLKSVVIPDGIEELDHVFDECEQLTSVKLPDSIKKLDGAFSDCTALTTVTIPDNAESLNGTFEGCTSLKSISIPSKVTDMKQTFSNCSQLESVTVPSSVQNMRYAFEYCTSLKSANIPDGVTDITGTFRGCSLLKAMSVPESVEEMEFAFNDCSALETVNIPEGLTSLGSEYTYGIFENCVSLKTITIPEGVTEIGSSVFAGCIGLTSVTLPQSLTHIWDNAFSGCSSLESITIPEQVTDIGWSAFIDCTGLTSLTIPASVRNINGSAFNGCANLKNVEFEADGSEDTFFGYDAFGSLTEDVTIEIPRRSRVGQTDFYSSYFYPSEDNYESSQYFGNAKVLVKSNGVTYTHVEYIEATCTADGRSEYYIGSDGKYYNDANGYDEVTEADSEDYFIIPAYGHNYRAVSWIWTKLDNSEGYSAIAKIGCYLGDLDVFAVEAEVTSETSEEGTTYHAAAKIPETDYAVYYDYFVKAATFTVSVDGKGGYVTKATKKDVYNMNDCVAVSAAKTLDGKTFAGWYIGSKCVSTNRNYTFFVSEDTTLTPKYTDTAAEEKVVESFTLTEREFVNPYWEGAGQKIQYINEWSLPEGYTIVEAGVIRAYDTDITDITPENAAANGIKVNKSTVKKSNGKYILTVKMSYSTALKTVSAKGYVIYRDAQGNEKTLFSDVQTSEYKKMQTE